MCPRKICPKLSILSYSTLFVLIVAFGQVIYNMDSIYAQRNADNTSRYSNNTALDNESLQNIINQTRSSLEAVAPGKPCNCVNFRFDDVQDYWLQGAQLSAFEHFLSRNFPLTLGIIMGGTGEDLKIIEKVRQGNQDRIFELAIHGWNHLTKHSRKSRWKIPIQRCGSYLAIILQYLYLLRAILTVKQSRQ